MKTPKFRFKGYTDDWEQRKLGEVVEDMYNGQTPSRARDDYWGGEICWLSSGELNRGTVYQNKETITSEGQKSANLRLVPKGTFVMAITGLEAAGTRGNCAILGFDTTLNQSCMALFPRNSMLDTKFLFQWYRLVGEQYGITYTQGTKQQSYNAEILSDLDICLPAVDEQRKIATVLEHLDTLITLHQRKCDALKELKKGMLQKMFPKEGAKVPEFRFKGFTGDWEQRKVSELCSISTGKSNTQDKVEDGAYPFYVRSPIIERSTKYLYDEEAVLTVGDGVGTGKVFHYVNGKYDLHQRCYRMHGFTEELNAHYFYHTFSKLFYNRVMAMTAKTSVDSVRMEMIADMKIPCPHIKEQEKIGHYLDTLDNLITLHQRKCDALKELKKGMLQKMFPEAQR